MAGTVGRAKAPSGSPFADGGLVVIEGATGTGKIELAEHITAHCATQFQMLPVFGTMGPRPGESTRMAIELLRSMAPWPQSWAQAREVAVYRLSNPGLPAEDAQALQHLLTGQQVGVGLRCVRLW